MPSLTKPKVEARTFTEAQLRVFIRTLMSKRDKDGTQGRFAKLHSDIQKRDAHFYNLPSVDQKLPPPHDDVEPYQSDILRKTWGELKARMQENLYAFRVTPAREGQSKIANDF